MIPSIDYLTLTVAGAILMAGAASGDPNRLTKLEFGLLIVGLFLFIIGVGRAFMSAFGL